MAQHNPAWKADVDLVSQARVLPKGTDLTDYYLHTVPTQLPEAQKFRTGLDNILQRHNFDNCCGQSPCSVNAHVDAWTEEFHNSIVK